MEEPMRLDDFTDEALDAFNDATQMLHELRHTTLDVEHLVLALLRQPAGLLQRVLADRNVDAADVTRRLLRKVPRRARWSSWRPYSTPTQLYVSKQMQRVLLTATHEATYRGDTYVGSAHLLMAIVAERTGAAARVLHNVGVTPAWLAGRLWPDRQE
jgi:ATP-dependent Clp protease ATP-binding subunit ClpC